MVRTVSEKTGPCQVKLIRASFVRQVKSCMEFINTCLVVETVLCNATVMKGNYQRKLDSAKLGNARPRPAETLTDLAIPSRDIDRPSQAMHGH
jgi:hypothetical protein